MKTDDYYRQVEELPVIGPLTAYDEVQCYPGLFDMLQVMYRITTEAYIHKRYLCRRDMYPICDSPVPTTSGFVPHKPSPTFKPIDPAAPTPASGSTSQGSAQHNSPATDSSPTCGQCTPQGTNTIPPQQSNTGMSNYFLSTPPVMPHHHNKLLHSANSLPLLHTIPLHRMLYHGNLLYNHLNHLSSLLLHASNSSCCSSHQLLHHRLPTSSKASHHSYNPGLALKVNILGNKGTHPPYAKFQSFRTAFHSSCGGTTKLSAQHPGT